MDLRLWKQWSQVKMHASSPKALKLSLSCLFLQYIICNDVTITAQTLVVGIVDTDRFLRDKMEIQRQWSTLSDCYQTSRSVSDLIIYNGYHYLNKFVKYEMSIRLKDLQDSSCRNWDDALLTLGVPPATLSHEERLRNQFRIWFERTSRAFFPSRDPDGKWMNYLAYSKLRRRLPTVIDWKLDAAGWTGVILIGAKSTQGFTRSMISAVVCRVRVMNWTFPEAYWMDIAWVLSNGDA